METELGQKETAANWSRPEVCPDCGYSLQGLGEEGRCPECGWEFGDGVVVVYSWGEMPTVARGPWGRKVLMVVIGAFVLMLLAAIVGAVFNRPFPRLVTFLWMGNLLAFSAPFALMLIRRSRSQQLPAPLQIRFTAEGHGLREGVGKVKIKPWRRAARVTLSTDPKDRKWLTIDDGMRWWGRRFEVIADERKLTAMVEKVREWIAKGAGRR